jgi:hypothetical protein
MKNIINIAWAVIILLYSWLSAIYWTPGPLNSNLIKTEKAVPNNPENKANIKYSVPISLAFEDRNHLSVHKDMLLFNTDKLLCDSFDSSPIIFTFLWCEIVEEKWGETGKL